MVLRWRLATFSCVLLATACGDKGGYCPGLCPTDSTFPTRTIEVDDGSATIASAEVVGGPCSHLLLRSEGEAGAPTGYAAAQITYYGPAENPATCQVKLTSLFGDTSVVTMRAIATSYEAACCPLGSCCVQTSAITIHKRVVFDQPAQTISFPTPSVDGGAVDAASDAPGNAGDNTIDADGYD